MNSNNTPAEPWVVLAVVAIVVVAIVALAIVGVVALNGHASSSQQVRATKRRQRATASGQRRMSRRVREWMWETLAKEGVKKLPVLLMMLWQWFRGLGP